ncbi:MAG: acyl-CoA dehydrogenase family protein [Acidimicrobiales bacterium]
MDLELSSNQQIFLETTRRFLESRGSPTRTRQLHEEGRPFDPAFWRDGAELGWTSLLVSENRGGGSISGRGLLDLIIVAEEFGRMVSAGPLLSTNVVLEVLDRADNAEKHANPVSQLLSGDETATWAIHEGPETSTRVDVSMLARADEDGWVVDGTKTFVLDAPSSDWFLVTVRTAEGLTQFLVPKDRDGLTVDARTSLDLVRQVGDVHFSGMRVTAVDLVGQVGGAAESVDRQMLTSLVLQNAETVGAADRVLEFTLNYACDRIAFGRSIASYQALKHRFANMKVCLEACHATVQASSRAVADDAPDAPELVSIAKSYVADVVPSMVQDCVQLHGGIGVTWEHDVHLYLRRVTQNAFFFGGTLQHREQIATAVGM